MRNALMTNAQTFRVAMIALGKVNIAPLIEAAKGRGWAVSIADGMNHLQHLINADACDAVVITGDSPQDLSTSTVHELIGHILQTPIFCVFPRGREASDVLALQGLTLTNVWDSKTDPCRLMDAVEQEMAEALENRPEYVLMCVDDDSDFLASMRQLLKTNLRTAFRRMTLDLQFHSDPQDALSSAKAQSKPIALVISDQVMPHMPGLELLEQIKSLCPDTQKVLLTGYAGIESAIRAVNDRLLDKYLTKPIEDRVDFLNIIQHLVREFHLRRVGAMQRQSLMAQFEFIRVITGAKKLDFALETTSKFLMRQTSSNWVSLMMWDDDHLVERASGTDQINIETSEDEEFYKNLGQKMNESLMGRLIESLPGCKRQQTDLNAAFAVPLRTDSAFLGVLLLGVRKGRSISRGERLLVNFVADVASITIGRFKDRQALEEYYVGTMASLMDVVEAKDMYTRGHTDRVMDLAVALARRVGMNEDDIKHLQYAASLHDLGKLAVPEFILTKPGRLEPWEYGIIKEHPDRADTILSHLRFLDHARMIIRSHHERYDGTGYPDGLRGEEILLGGRILAVVDSYDAMTSTRPYRTAMGPLRAIEEIRAGAGTQFDPMLAAEFIDMINARMNSKSPKCIEVVLKGDQS